MRPHAKAPSAQATAREAPRPGRTTIAGMLALALVACCGIGASAAGAATVHPFQENLGASTTEPSFVNPETLAVDPATHDLYVLDSEAGLIKRFHPDGEPAGFSASAGYISGNELTGTSEGGFAFRGAAENQLAVAPPGSPAGTAGDLYVTEPFAGIDVFAPSGEYLGRIADAGGASITEACGVATDPAGDLYVGTFNGGVAKYLPGAGFPATTGFDSKITGTGGICNIAAGASTLYASLWDRGPLTAYTLSLFPGSQGEADASGQGTVIEDGGSPATSYTAAVDPATSDLFLSEGNRGFQLDAAGNPIGHFGAGKLTFSHGIAPDAAEGLVYAADSSTRTVYVYGTAEAEEPIVTIEAPTNVTTSSATLHGSVDPNGTEPLEDTSWRFEYSTDGGSSWTQGPLTDIGTGTSAVPVEEGVSGFIPNQEVRVRLVAVDAGGLEVSAQLTFTTTALPPDITTDPAQDIAPEHAALLGRIHPHNSQTTYWFEYGESETYGASIPAGEDAETETEGNANAIQRVEENLYGLQPHTTYHYRLVGENSTGGLIKGADRSFETTTPPAEGGCANESRRGEQHSSHLPDCRAYELVSPPDKNGADVLVDSRRVRAAATESPGLPMAATFASLGAFGDVHGSGVGSDYMAIRDGEAGTSGWATHGITPPQQPINFHGVLSGFETEWMGDFSPDLSRGVLKSSTPLTDAPEVKDAVNLYRREDLRDPGIGTYQLLSECPLCAGTPLPVPQQGQVPFPAGASADFSHVIFESPLPLTADAPSTASNCLHDLSECRPNLYEWADGALRFVGLVPPPGQTSCGGSGPACMPAAASVAGADGGTAGTSGRKSPHTISPDGSRIVFTDSSAGSIEDSTGNLYERVDGAETVQINVSEREPCLAEPEHEGCPPEPAKYQDASADLSRVFFTSNAQLTDEDNGSRGLYMWSAAPDAEGHHLTLVSADHEPADGPSTVQGVIGASDDGSYLYFIQSGQDVAGQAELDTGFGIYEWHEGTTTFVGQLANLNQTNDETFDVWPDGYAEGMQARVTPDGRHMLFQSSTGAGLTGYDSNHRVEFYLWSAGTQTLQCASCRPDGTPAGGIVDVASTAVISRAFTGGTLTNSYQNHPLSADGSRVFFTTTDALVPGDTNDLADAYEFDSPSGTVQLLSSGTSHQPSYFMDASPDGSDAFFTTRERLVGWDVDGANDLYDARGGGGLPEPAPRPAPCLGEGCMGAPSSPPALPAPAFEGAPNPAKPKRHKHHHRKHRHHHKHRKHHRRADHDRRTSR